MGTAKFDEADERQLAGIPDPGVARDGGQFVAQLNRLRTWAGCPSLRVLRSLSGPPASAGRHGVRSLSVSTTHEVLTGKRLPRLPRLEFVEAFVTACLRARSWPEGQIEEEVERWRRVWRVLALPPDLRDAGAPEPVPVPAVLPEPSVTVVPAPPGLRRWWWIASTVSAFLLGAVAGLVGDRLVMAESAEGADLAARGDRPASAVVREEGAGAGGCVVASRPAGAELLDDRAFSTPGRWDLSASNLDVAGDGGRLEIRVLGGTAEPWDAILMRRELVLTEGRRYTLAFDIRTSAAVRLRVTVQENRPPEYRAVLMRDFHAGSTLCHRSYSFVPDRDIVPGEITFQFGGHAEDLRVELVGLSLVEEAG